MTRPHHRNFSPQLRFGALRHRLFGCSKREAYRQAIGTPPFVAAFMRCCRCGQILPGLPR